MATSSGGPAPTPSLELNMSLVDCMVTMQRQQTELVEAVRRLAPSAVSGVDTQATASVSEPSASGSTVSVATSVLASSSSTKTTSSGTGEYVYYTLLVLPVPRRRIYNNFIHVWYAAIWIHFCTSYYLQAVRMHGNGL